MVVWRGRFVVKVLPLGVRPSYVSGDRTHTAREGHRILDRFNLLALGASSTPVQILGMGGGGLVAIVSYEQIAVRRQRARRLSGAESHGVSTSGGPVPDQARLRHCQVNENSAGRPPRCWARVLL